GPSFELLRFSRGCDALWSPDSSRIAVTDWWASDRSDVFIYSVAGRVSKRTVAKLLPKTAIPKKERCGHCYFEARKWLDFHRLQIKISGHTDEAPVYGFEHEYIFDLASGRFQEVKKKPNQPVH